MNDESAWRDSLKAGDEVVIGGINYGNSYDLGSVIRVTKTLIIVKRGIGTAEYNYRKRDGYLVSSDKWSRTYLRQPTADIMEEIAVARLRSKACRMKDALNVPTNRKGLEAFIAALAPLVKP